MRGTILILCLGAGLLLGAGLFPARTAAGPTEAGALGSALSTLDDRGAGAFLARAHGCWPDDPHLNLALARLALAEEKAGQAAAYFQKAEGALRDDLEAQLVRAELWVRQGRVADARALLENLARAHPRDPRVPLAQADAARRLMQFDAAVHYYAQYLNLPDPDQYRRERQKVRYVRLANALAEYKQQQEALKNRRRQKKTLKEETR